MVMTHSKEKNATKIEHLLRDIAIGHCQTQAISLTCAGTGLCLCQKKQPNNVISFSGIDRCMRTVRMLTFIYLFLGTNIEPHTILPVST